MYGKMSRKGGRTLTAFEPSEPTGDDVADRARDVNGRSFLADGQTRRDGDGLHTARVRSPYRLEWAVHSLGRST